MTVSLHFPITLFYAALLGLLFVVLTFNVMRWQVKNINDPTKVEPGKPERITRVQGNFTESVPLGLILLFLLELNGAAPFFVHGLGILLVVARVLHAIGMTRKPLISLCRILGIQATLMMLLIASVAALALTL